MRDGEVAGPHGHESVRNGTMRLDRNGMTGTDGLLHRVGLLWLDADDAAVRKRLPEICSNAADQPAPTDRHEHDVRGRPVLRDLQPYGSLPGDDARVVEGRNDREPLLGGDRPRACLTLHGRRSLEHDLRAEGSRAFHLHAWC